jgi:MFS family permease
MYIDAIKSFSGRAWLLLLIVFIFSVAGGSGVIFNLYLLELGYDMRVIGSTVGIGNFSIAFFSLFCGIFCRKIGIKAGYLLGICCIAFSDLGYVVGRSILVIIASLSVGSLGYSLTMVSSEPIAVEVTDERNRPAFFSISSMLALGGMAVGSFVFGNVADLLVNSGYAKLYAYRTIFLATALLTLGGAIIMVFLKISATSKVINEKEKLFLIYRESFVKKILITNLVIGLGAGLFIPFMNIYFKEVHHASDAQIGFIISMLTLSMAVGMGLSPLLDKLLGRVESLCLTQIASIPPLIMLAFIKNINLAGGAAVLRSMFMNCAQPLFSVMVMENVGPDKRTIVSGARAFTWGITFSISSFVSGFLIKSGGFKAVFLISAVIYIVYVGLFWQFFKYMRKSGKLQG